MAAQSVGGDASGGDFAESDVIRRCSFTPLQIGNGLGQVATLAQDVKRGDFRFAAFVNNQRQTTRTRPALRDAGKFNPELRAIRLPLAGDGQPSWFINQRTPAEDGDFHTLTEELLFNEGHVFVSVEKVWLVSRRAHYDSKIG